MLPNLRGVQLSRRPGQCSAYVWRGGGTPVRPPSHRASTSGAVDDGPKVSGGHIGGPHSLDAGRALSADYDQAYSLHSEPCDSPAGGRSGGTGYVTWAFFVLVRYMS